MIDDYGNNSFIERRATTADFHQLVDNYHLLDTRVAVVETRLDNQDHRLAVIESEIRSIRETVEQTLEKINQHAATEAAMQIRLLIGIGVTFIGVLAGQLGIQLPSIFH